jgi:hypothetical protein
MSDLNSVQREVEAEARLFLTPGGSARNER